MTQNEIIEYWLNQATDDIESANIMFNSKKYMYASFMLQQCIEKSLKAYFIYKKNKPHPYTHNIVFLSETTGLIKSMSECQKNLLLKLNPLYIEARYEDYKNEVKSILTNEYCTSLIKETEELFIWIKQLIE